MLSPLLSTIESDDFQSRYWYIGTPTALHRALRRAPEVLAIQNALRTGEVTEEEVQQFSSRLLEDVRKGQLCPHDLTFAALATALEGHTSEFADQYVSSLADLELVELKMSIRVARQCLADRMKSTKTTQSTVQLVKLPAPIATIAYEQFGSFFPGTLVGSTTNKTVLC
jgi:hypothetical protein